MCWWSRRRRAASTSPRSRPCTRTSRTAASEGVGVLLISEDLDEILALSDRVAVMYEGAVVGEVRPEDATVEEIGLLMAGGSGA